MRMDELMSNYILNDTDSEIVKGEELSKGEKDRILAAALKKIDGLEAVDAVSGNFQGETKMNNEIKRGLRSGRRIAILAAAALLCCGIVFAFATGYIQIGQSFVNFLGIDNADELAGMNSVTDIMAENKGWKAEFKEVLGDSNSLYLRFDLVAPEGTVFDSDTYNLRESNIDINRNQGVKPAHGYGWSFDYLKDEDIEGDNVLPMMLLADYSGKLTGQMLYVKLEGLYGYTYDETVPDGEIMVDYDDVMLEAEIPLDYAKKSLEKKVSEEIELDGKRLILETVEISPISISLNFKTPLTSIFDEEAGAGGGSSDDELVLVMKDGTRTSGWRSWSSFTHGKRHSVVYQSNTQLHPDEVEALIINGTEINL